MNARPDDDYFHALAFSERAHKAAAAQADSAPRGHDGEADAGTWEPGKSVPSVAPRQKLFPSLGGGVASSSSSPNAPARHPQHHSAHNTEGHGGGGHRRHREHHEDKGSNRGARLSTWHRSKWQRENDDTVRD